MLVHVPANCPQEILELLADLRAKDWDVYIDPPADKLTGSKFLSGWYVRFCKDTTWLVCTGSTFEQAFWGVYERATFKLAHV